MRLPGFTLALLAVSLGTVTMASCSSQIEAKERYVIHKFKYGKTAYVGPDGKATAPPHAPPEVRRMVAAANSLTDKPYRYGGGHASFQDTGYDCSGSVSYVLHAGGVLKRPLASRGFLDYGEKGYGKWVTLYVRKGHVFLVIAGLRFDAGGTWNSAGPRWKPQRRSTKGCYVRHPKGL